MVGRALAAHYKCPPYFAIRLHRQTRHSQLTVAETLGTIGSCNVRWWGKRRARSRLSTMTSKERRRRLCLEPAHLALAIGERAVPRRLSLVARRARSRARPRRG